MVHGHGVENDVGFHPEGPQLGKVILVHARTFVFRAERASYAWLKAIPLDRIKFRSHSLRTSLQSTLQCFFQEKTAVAIAGAATDSRYSDGCDDLSFGCDEETSLISG